MSLDPVLAWSLRAALALLFGAAALHKLRAPRDFRLTLADYALLPAWAIAPLAGAFPVLEIGLAIALLLPATAAAAAWAAALLLLVYAAAMGINVARGREALSCGCIGPAADQPVHAGLLFRNGVLALFALAAALPAEARPWLALDFVTSVAAVAALALLYVSADGLMAASRRAALS